MHSVYILGKTLLKKNHIRYNPEKANRREGSSDSNESLGNWLCHPQHLNLNLRRMFVARMVPSVPSCSFSEDRRLHAHPTEKVGPT